MIYTVKSKEELGDLIELLNEASIKTNCIEPTLLEAHLLKEEDFDIFKNVLNIFVTFKAVETIFYKALKKAGLAEKVVRDLVYEELSNKNNMNYYVTITNVLVMEYLKSMCMFNIDSFILFNMKGLKEELTKYAENIVSELTMNNDDENLYEELRERALGNGMKTNSLKELHLQSENNFVVIKDKDNRIIDNDFFLEFLGSVIEFSFEEDIKNVDILETIMMVSSIMRIFDVSKIVIHNSISNEVKNQLLYNLNSLKVELDKRIKVVICNGCDKCE